MAFTELTDNLNIISQLPDQPELSADALKEKFDEAGNTIKDYINGALKEYLLGLAAGGELNIKSITTAKLADGAVTTEKLADGGVTADKLSALSGLKLTSAAYGDTFPANPVVGQVFFKRVT
jgi:hypothetical protein